MTEYLVNVAFEREPDPALLPAERDRLRELADEGVLQAAYLSAARSEAWLMIRGDGREAVGTVLASLPLFPYMEIRGSVAVVDIGPSADDPAQE